MHRIFWILLVFISFQSIAESCYIEQEDQYALGEKHRKSFKFSFWETPQAGTVFMIEVPASMNDEKFTGALLVKGPRAKVKDSYGIHVGFMPHDTEQGMLMSAMSMERHMLEGAELSISYGHKSCTPTPVYRISELLADKNNWPYR